MTTLIRTEWLKMKKYNAFWWIMGITALSYPGINYIFYMIYDSIIHNPSKVGQAAKMIIGNPFSFPDVWHTVAYASSIFIFIPAVVVIMFITNEYSFKTHRQNIIDGWSRHQFVTSKLIDVLIITLIITLLYFGVALVAGFVSHDRLLRDTWGKSYYIGLFALQTFSQLSIAFLIGFLVRKAFIALGFFFFYIILEHIIVNILRYYGSNARHFLPMEVSDRMIPVPGFIGQLDKEAYEKSLEAVQQQVILTLILTAAIWVICFWINKKRDLK